MAKRKNSKPCRTKTANPTLYYTFAVEVYKVKGTSFHKWAPDVRNWYLNHAEQVAP